MPHPGAGNLSRWFPVCGNMFWQARTALKKGTDFLMALSQRKNNSLRRCDHG